MSVCIQSSSSFRLNRLVNWFSWFRPGLRDSFDTNKDKFIDFEELKRMMEKVGSPQTHLALKAMIREVDEDGDNRISFREVW